MKKISFAVIVLAVFTMAGCSAEDRDQLTDSVKQDASNAAYRAALAAISSDLAEVSDATAESGSSTICQEITSGKTADVLANNAATRFGVDQQLGAAIVEVTRKHICTR